MTRIMKKITYLFAAMLVATSIVYARTALSSEALVSAELTSSFTAKQIAAMIRKYVVWPGHEEMVNKLIASATAVDAYTITYLTLDVVGQTTVASGLVAVPSPAGSIYPIVQYHHGTQFNNQDVPSNIKRSPEASILLALFSSQGYVTSLPDYLGQGEGEPPHPYLQSGPMATATADMLKAVSELCTQLGVKTTSKLFICGLSEGGHTTLALQKHIETDPDAQPFQLTASAPMAGPYDVRGEWNYLVQSNPPGATPLLVHFYLSFKRAYGFEETLQDVFISPYDQWVETIDNGTLDGHQMYELLPKTTQEIMHADFLAAVESGRHPLYQAMEENNTYNFLPRTPTRLYHGSDDKLVPYSISELTCARMKLLGAADVEVVNVGAYRHEASLIPSLLMAKEWFESVSPPWIYDYNGDGTSEIAIYRGTSGLWAIRGVTRIYFGGTTDEPVPGDYTGNGTTDVGVYRGTNGLWAIRGTTRVYYGSSIDLPESGDYDGDGTADIGIFRNTTGLWAIRGVTRVYFGGVADSPASGYYDGDATKDIGIFRGSSGLWAIRTVTRIYFGSSSDTIVPGDYDGDGAWETAIFRGSSGLWAIRGVTRSYFGGSTDEPVPADYDGDSRDYIGIFRSYSGLWAIQGVSRVYFGGSGDIPVTR